MIDLDERITELDVMDPLTVWVHCEDCPHTDCADMMVRQQDGAWLCGPCDRQYRADAEDALRAAMGW